MKFILYNNDYNNILTILKMKENKKLGIFILLGLSMLINDS